MNCCNHRAGTREVTPVMSKIKYFCHHLLCAELLPLGVPEAYASVRLAMTLGLSGLAGFIGFIGNMSSHVPRQYVFPRESDRPECD